MSLRDQLLETARAFTQAHGTHDWDLISALLAEGATHSAGPNFIYGPERNTEQYLAFERQVTASVKSHSLTINDAIADEVRRTAVLYCVANGATDTASFEVEIIVTLTLTDDGKKVLKNRQYTDSKAMGAFIDKQQQAAKGQ